MARKVKCKHCQQDFNGRSISIGAIYHEKSVSKKSQLVVNYFVCSSCFDPTKDFHNLSHRSGWSHLYGDISGNDTGWMKSCLCKTRDIVCGRAGYYELNESSRRGDYLKINQKTN